MKSGTKITSTLAAPVMLLIAYMLPTRAAAAPRGRKAPATSTPPRARRASRRTARRARSLPRTTARSTRSSASRTARHSTSASFGPRAPAWAATPTPPRRMRSAQTPSASSTSSMTSPEKATISSRRRREHFKGPAKGGFDTQPIADMAPDHDRRAQGLWRLHHAGHGFPQQQRHRHRDRR